MNCMKCGRETPGEQVFCENCLRTMEKYPVQPGTAVKLPQRKETTVIRRAPKRRTVNPEEQIKVLKTRVIRLAVLLFLAVAIIVFLAPAAISHLTGDRRKPGQNYSVITTTASTEATGQEGP